MTTGYDDIENLQNQTNQLYDEQMKQQENIINTGTQQAIDELERNKLELQKQTDKTNRALYSDYQKQVNPYGTNAENLAEQGLGKSGLAESTRANYYNTYQNSRTEAMNNANTIKANFDSEIAKARQNGDIQKAQALFNLYSQRINDLSNMYNLKFQADQFAYQKEQDTLAQSNWEKEYQQALQQAQWQQQFSENQFNYNKEQDALAQSNWNREFDYNKEQNALSQSNWEREFAEALKQAQWEQSFNQSQFDYQKVQDAQAQKNWQQEFNLAKKKSSSSGSSGGGNTINVNSGNNEKGAQKELTPQEILANVVTLQGPGIVNNIKDKSTGKTYASINALLNDYGLAMVK